MNKLQKLKIELGLIRNRDGVFRYKFKPKNSNCFYDIYVIDGYWYTDFIADREFFDLRELLQNLRKTIGG
jgi:hypothetical protein